MIPSFVFIILFFLGIPIFVLMALMSIYFYSSNEIDTSAMAIEMYRVASAPTLLTIPLFTLAGHILAKSKSPLRILNLGQSFVGGVPGGMAIMSLILCAIFTAFTGASGITIVALGGLIYPILTQKGYKDSFAVGLVTTSGSLGLLLPPSLPVILYGIVAKVDIEQIFLAGLLPTFFILTVLSCYAFYVDKKSGLSKEKSGQINRLNYKDALWQARFELPLPILILGGIYAGIITVLEASTLTLFYVYIITFHLYKDLSIKRDLFGIISESMRLVGAILIILCVALGFTGYLVDAEVPMHVLAWMKSYIHDKYTFLLALNLFLLVVGSFMDIFSAIIVVVPLITPLAESYGINPIHMAIIFLTNLEIGYITPPVGINLFIASFQFNKSVFEIYNKTKTYFILLIMALLVITYVPELSLLWVK